MYLGFALILVGVGVILGSLSTLVLAASFVPLTNRLYIRNEEAELSRLEGDTWQAYAAKVRRWL